MKRLLLAGVAALSVLSASAAHAAQQPHVVVGKPRVVTTGSGINLLPPPQYDKQYDGELEMQRISTQAEIDRVCEGTSHYSCASRSRDGKRCWIFMATDDVLKRSHMDYAFALRHELAHCNGWHHPHPNALKRKHFQAGDTWNEAEGAKWVVIGHFGTMPILPERMRILATYPPVVCITPEWKEEPCKNRETAMAVKTPLPAWGETYEDLWRWCREHGYPATPKCKEL